MLRLRNSRAAARGFPSERSKTAIAIFSTEIAPTWNLARSSRAAAKKHKTTMIGKRNTAQPVPRKRIQGTSSTQEQRPKPLKERPLKTKNQANEETTTMLSWGLRAAYCVRGIDWDYEPRTVFAGFGDCKTNSIILMKQILNYPGSWIELFPRYDILFFVKFFGLVFSAHFCDCEKFRIGISIECVRFGLSSVKRAGLQKTLKRE